MTEDDNIRLGGNISLAGFGFLKGSEMVVIKKIVGNHARRIEELCKNFTELKLHLKPLHKTEEKVKKFELHGKVIDDGHVYPANLVEHNVFVGVDAVCKKLINELSP